VDFCDCVAASFIILRSLLAHRLMWVFNFKLKTMNSILILMMLSGVLVGGVLAYLFIRYNSKKLSFEISQKVETEMTYPGQFKVTVIRETRAVNFAK
jgi:hypothetical protein